MNTEALLGEGQNCAEGDKKLQEQELSAKRNKEQVLRDVCHMQQVCTQETRLLEKSRDEK